MIKCAVLLAGGQGSRVKEILDIPKPLFKISGEPHIVRLLKWCRLIGIRRTIIIISEDDKSCFDEDLEKAIKRIPDLLPEITICVEEKRQGTGMWIIRNLGILPERFAVMNCDTIYTQNISGILRACSVIDESVMLTYKEMVRSDTDCIDTDSNGFVLSIGRGMSSSISQSNSGFYVFSRQSLDEHCSGLIKSEAVSIESDIFPRLIKGKRLKGFTDAFNQIFDFGSKERIAEADRFWNSSSYKWVFVDRDGTLNKDDRGYTYESSDLVIVDKIAMCLKGFQDRGYFICIVTNQSGIGRGFFTESDMIKFNDSLCGELLEKYNVRVSHVLYCPHLPEEGCTCRKPKIGHIERLIEETSIDGVSSLLIGNSSCDREAANRLGVDYISYEPSNQ
jgi:D-glycero-D-manno-heptose 1,7-bisphosphate phosphatase